MTTAAFRVEFTEPAVHQAERAAAWWRAHRLTAPNLFDDELDQSLELLANRPLLTQI